MPKKSCSGTHSKDGSELKPYPQEHSWAWDNPG